MSVLITADVHIKNYAKFNKAANSRLNQFVALAHLMAQTCREQNVKTVIIAGDLLDEYKPEPIVYQTLHEFLDVLADAAKIYIIGGNHDAPKSGYDAKNVYYPILAKSSNNRIEVLHDDFRIIDGKQFYFRGWEPDLREFPKADVLITHVFINGATLPSGLRVAGDGNVSGDYSLCFAGDIHKHQQVGRVIIPGTPLQQSFSDDPDTGYIVLDTDKLTWERISTKDNAGFLRFRYDDNAADVQKSVEECYKTGLDENTAFEDLMFDKYNIVYKRREIKDKTKPFEFKNIGAISINDILNELIKDFQYRDELLGVVRQGSLSAESFIQQELKVTLKDIEITNFKSIANFKMDFTSLNKLTLITGQNGAGKSTFLQALMWVLTGESPSEADDIIQAGKTYCEVKLNVEYQNTQIRIERSRGSKFDFKVKANDRSVTASSKADLQKSLEEILPIITKLHLLYLNQSRDGFLSELNDAARVSLMSELSGQSIVADMTEQVDEYVAKLKSESDSEEAKHNALCNKITALTSQYDDTITDPLSEIETLNIDLINIKTAKTALISDRTEIADAMRKEFDAKEAVIRDQIKKVEEKQMALNIESVGINKDITAYENIKNKKLSWVCHVCKTVITATDITEKDIEDAKAKLSELSAKRDANNKQKMEYDNLIKTANIKLRDARTELQSKIIEKVKTIDAELSKRDAEETQIRLKLNSLMERMGRFAKNQEIKKALAETEASAKIQLELKDAKKDKFAAFKKISNSVFGDDGLMSAAILERIATAINNDPEVKILTVKKLKIRICSTLISGTYS